MFGWIVVNYIIVVASSYVAEYFLQTCGGDIRNNATLIAYSYSAGSSVPLLVGFNCIYIALIDTSLPLGNLTVLDKFAILSLGPASPLGLLSQFSNTTYLGFEITNSLIEMASITALIVLLGKLADVSIARSGICILSTGYALQIFWMFLLGHTFGT
jgi:hypothetical protein